MLFFKQLEQQALLWKGLIMAVEPLKEELQAVATDVTRYKIRLIAEGYGEANAELVRFHSPVTVDALANALPFEGRAARWKEEIYFETPARLGSEKAKSKVEIGSMAYWPMGSALCIFYGPTQPYSPVNVVGNVTSNLEMFRTMKSGTRIRVEKV